jgi:hypothetical protein
MDRYRPLNSDERLYICRFVYALVPTARDRNHPMRELARRHGWDWNDGNPYARYQNSGLFSELVNLPIEFK